MDNLNQNFQKIEKDETEINLVDYWLIIWRRRNIFLLIFIGIVLITLVITLTAPRVYQSSALVTPAKISGQNVENTEAVISVLKQETTLRELAQKLNFPESMAPALINKFNVTQNADFWEVRGMDETPEKTKKIVEVVSDFVINRENLIATRFKPDLEAEITLLKNELIKNTTDITDLEEKISASSETTSPAQGYITASYIAILQDAKSRQDELQRDFYGKQRELNFQTRKSEIEVLPVLPIKPIKPNKESSLVIGAILGVFVGIFYTFTAEYFEKNKKKI